MIQVPLRSKCARRMIFRCLGWFFAGWYGWSVLGVPLARPVTWGDRFPCSDHGCGCESAQGCWADCCCFTPAERLAWAKQRAVKLNAATREQLTVACLEEWREASSGCCNSERCATDDQEAASLAARDACRGSSDAAECEAETAPPELPPWVLVLRRAGCRNQNPNATIAGDPNAPPPEIARWCPADPLLYPFESAPRFWSDPLHLPPTPPG